MKIAIIGTGGVGGYFGAKLARAGYDVTFLARGEHLNAIRKNGLTVKSIKGDFKIDVIKTTDGIKTIGFVDLVIVAVKAWQVGDIAKELTEIIHGGTIILPLQNGVLTIDELKKEIRPEHIIGGLCRIISKIDSPGVIRHFGIEPTIVFGELNNSRSERIHRIKALFENSGINAIISDNIIIDLWKKFIPICVSGLLAVTRTTYGELRELKETRQLMIELMTEIVRLAQSAGILIESGFADQAAEFIDSFPYESTSSLTRDVWEGKPSEIEYQNGAVVKLAEKYGIDAPVNRFVYHCIMPMEIKARNQ